MELKHKIRQIITFIKHFFPINLLVSHVKHNLLALFYWVILFLIIFDQFGSAYGIPYLFFSPEYLGSTNCYSFFLLGISISGFIMGFNTYSYIKLGAYYPFLIVVSKPFLKFCLNNFIIPLVFNVTFIIQFSRFQLNEEFTQPLELFYYILAYIGGLAFLFTLAFFYFFPKRKNRTELVENLSNEDTTGKPINSFLHKKEEWFTLLNQNDEKSYIYLGSKLKLLQSRSIRHLDQQIIENVFAKNKINTSIFEIITIISFLTLGFFRDYSIFEMPAAMIYVLLFTIILMLFSAMLSWFKRWTYPIIILTFLLMNQLSIKSNLFRYTNYAYGLSYEKKEVVPYSIDKIESLARNESLRKKSEENYLKILENWKKKTGEDKPKLIILNTSGGGSRSALWTFTVLQETDEFLKGKLSKHLHLMTGASGGMVGAAYYRELLLRYKLGKIRKLYSGEYKSNIAKDILNKLFFAAATNDLFFRYQTTSINGHEYTKDRGYSFEEKLNINTDNVMNHTLGYYEKPEQNALIPMMIFNPTIVNDGRRMLISSQSMSFLSAQNTETPSRLTNSYENLDYQSYFSGNTPNEIQFTSVVRTQATFPFILPMVTMPTSPEIQLMDAGLRDNYGAKTMIEVLHVMKDWIEENTSGVIILQVRDTKKILNNEVYRQISLADKISLPFGNMYKNFTRTQDFDQEELMKVGLRDYCVPVDIISFNLRENSNDRISLSWHLTKNEKQKIERAFKSIQNQVSLRRLKTLLY
jgi:hypothetical protein